MNEIADKKIRSDAAMLLKMVEIYCADYHPDGEKGNIARRGVVSQLDLSSATLCVECARLLIHGLVKRINCPLEPKPRCKHCPEPCFAGEYREFVKAVMRYSGLKLIKSGRVDLIWMYFF